VGRDSEHEAVGRGDPLADHCGGFAGMFSGCSHVPMPRHERDLQPQDVSETVTNYLDMTSPRRRKANRARPGDDGDDEQSTERPWRLIDNEGLPLEAGNDFAGEQTSSPNLGCDSSEVSIDLGAHRVLDRDRSDG
jgi:hypothetical protein